MKNKKTSQILLVAGIALAALNSFAGSFTPGNLVVERLGDGTESLSINGNTMFFDEYNTGSIGQSPVQSITIPDGTAQYGTVNPMIEAGTGGTTGSITLSPDGQTISFPGYATTLPNTTSLPGAASTTVPRSIGALNASGAYTRIATSTAAFSASNIRGAVTDGENNYWGIGTASTTTVNAGVYYFGTAGSATEVFPNNLRSGRIFNGALWFTTDSSTPGVGIYEFNGQPTTAATPTKVITFGANDSDYNFVVSPDGHTIYEADDGGTSATSAGIHKWTGSGTSFTLDYVLLNNGTTGTGCFGLTVDWTTSPPTLYATTSTSSANSLIKVQDTGSGATATTLATAAAKTYFRGVAFVPTNAVGVTLPQVTGIFPASQTVNAGANAQFTVSAIGTPPLSYYWYAGSVSQANLLPSQATSTLTLNDVFGPNAGNYICVVSNANPSHSTSTSSAATLSVTDPVIDTEPGNEEGLTGGTVEFTATATGTGLSYQWWFADSSGDLLSKVPNGSIGFGTASGAKTSTLTISDVQPTDPNNDPTNFVLVVTGTYNTVNSSVATLFSVDPSAYLAFWDFNGPTFNNVTPPPFIGVGNAILVNLPPFTTTIQDPNDGLGNSFPEGQDLPPNGTWGTSSYPASGSNKLCGIQFNVSTVGARNIQISYDSRVSPTASDYERLQYTTDGATWIDYPSSSSFNGHAGTGNGGFLPFFYDLTGFPGVDNNPNFGIRLVTEFQSTATYGAGVHGVTTNNYVGTANTYGTGGTVTYDIVGIAAGEAYTGTDTPPTITSIANQSTADNVPITVDFTVGSADVPASQLTPTAEVLNSTTVSPNLTFGGSGANRTLTITPNSIPDSIDAAPILVRVTDPNGLSTVTWFDLTLTSAFQPPTNTLTSITGTNMLADSSLTIPFTVGSQTQPAGNLTYSVSSDNNTVIPSGDIVVNNQGTTHPSVTITPATGELGQASIQVTVDDNNPQDSKSTTATIPVMVRPNTNVVFLDYFNDDQSGSLDTVEAGIWNHLSGIETQMQLSSASTGGSVSVNTGANTENLQVSLLKSPYSDAVTDPTNLFAAFTVNMDEGNMPVGTGSYFALFNDGSGTTGNYECALWADTNNVAAGDYRLGIVNFPVSEGAAGVQFFPQGLTPGVNYVVVMQLAVSNGFSTLWINPVSQSSSSAADTTTATAAGATLFNISDFELRESGGTAGAPSIGELKVGTSFDSVFPSLSIATNTAGAGVVVNWSDPTLGIQSATDVNGPWTDVSGAEPPYTNTSTAAPIYYRFGH